MTKIPIIINALIMPAVPIISLVEKRNADPTKIDEDRMLPESKIFDFGFVLS